jgi:hypothetical protein
MARRSAYSIAGRHGFDSTNNVSTEGQERAMENLGIGNHSKSVLRCWQIVSGVALALSMGACAGSPDAKDVSIETDQNGAVVRISDPDHIMAPLPTDDENTFEKAGCTHIRFCTTPGTANTITCDTNDKACSNDARFNECMSDARFVCGRTSPMAFDPPIPCPITGVC